MSEDWLFRPDEVAKALGVSVRHVRREVASGRLPCTLVAVSPGGRLRRRFSMADVDSYLLAHCPASNREALLAMLRDVLAA